MWPYSTPKTAGSGGGDWEVWFPLKTRDTGMTSATGKSQDGMKKRVFHNIYLE